MDRKAFHELLKRYAENACSDAERQLIDQWYELLDDETVGSAEHVLNDEMEQRLWNNIKGRVRAGAAPAAARRAGAALVLPLGDPGRIPLPVGRNGWGKWVAAAAAVLLLGIGFYTYHGQKAPGADVLLKAELKEGLLEKINNSAARQNDTLEDGSLVVLEPGAKLAYPRHFAGEKREVYLEGTAFFAITKNASKPFYVYNDRLVTQVLGTSFTVKTGKEQVEVAVRTGRVAVYENGEVSASSASAPSNGRRETSGVIVTPNEKVTYYAEDRHFVTSLVDTPMAVAAVDGNGGQIKFVFDDAPLSKVLENLEKAYNIQISVENDNLNGCPFTGDISGQSLYDKLEMICESIRASYEIKGTAILIKGKGCN